MKKNLKRYIILSVILLLFGFGYAVYQTYLKEINFNVAVETLDSDEANALNSLNEWMIKEKRRYRFKLTAYRTKQGVYQAISERKAQFAVFRADEFHPRTMASITTLFQEKAVFALPTGSPIKEWKNFTGKTIGVIGDTDKDDMLLYNHLKLNGAANYKFISVTPEEATTQLKSRKLHAIAFVSPLISEFAPLTKIQGEFKFLDIEDAETLTSRDNRYNEGTINAATISAKYPGESLTTLEAQYHLFALKVFPNRLITALLNDIYDSKRAMMSVMPLLSQINPPDLETDAHVKVHAGAATYYNNEELTLTQFFTDNFYVIPMLIGAFGTLFVWLTHIFAPKHYFSPNQILLKNIDIDNQIRTTQDADSLLALKKSHSEMFSFLKRSIDNDHCTIDAAIPLLEAVGETGKKIDKRIQKLGIIYHNH